MTERSASPILVVAVGCLTWVSSALAGDKTLELADTVSRGGPSLRAAPPRWRWADDGATLSLDETHKDPRTWDDVGAPASGEDKDTDDYEARARRAALLAEVDGVDDERAKQLARARPVDTGTDGAALIEDRRGSAFYVVGPEQAHRLPDGCELPDLSPDGRHLAYVRGNDLYVGSASGDESRVTSNGGPDQFNGKLDWVYQEELYGRGDFKASWWSDDSRYLAFLALDEAAVEEFTVIDHIEHGHFRVKPEITNYPKSGDPNPTVALGVHDVTTGTTRFVDLTRYQDSEPLVVRVGWSPAGELWFVVQDRIQTWADLNALDPADLTYQTWVHEDNDTWVDRPEAPRFLADGSFLWRSNRTDHNHLYHYRDAHLIRAVTQGAWSIDAIDHVDEDAGLVWFRANKDGAVNSNLYRIGLDGRGLRRLTAGDGWHTTSFNHDRSLFLDTYQSLAEAPAIRLCDGDGEVLRELGAADVPYLNEYRYAPWELVEVRARDGFKLDAAVLKPVPFDPRARYPVFIDTYSGPDAPSVRNRWSSNLYHQFLAQNEVVVLQVNVRTASGKGHYAIEQCYKQLGVRELCDLEDAVDWVASQGFADGRRVGIGGYSYGGFMTAFALTHSDRFALGIAGGGVFDWRMYDTIYTERYMSTPQRNPDGYDRTSVLKAAASLQGHLLIHHGVMDDNVHVQNAMQLAYALQKAGKSFEIMLYPQSRHGVGDPDQRRHLRELEWRTVRNVLGGAKTSL